MCKIPITLTFEENLHMGTVNYRKTRERSISFPKLWLTAGWLLVGLVVISTLCPRTPVIVEFQCADKFSHLLAYAILMLWFANIYTQRRQQIRFILGLILLGICLEYLQNIGGYRQLQYSDMAANALGVILGWGSAKTWLGHSLAYFDRVLFNLTEILK